MKHLLLLLLVTLLAVPTVAYALEITFSPEAEVRSTSVTLADVAHFNEKTPLTMALGSRHVAVAAAPGEEIELDAMRIRARILKDLPGNTQILWRGAPRIVVRRTGIAVGPQQVSASIADYLVQKGPQLPVATYTFMARELPYPFVLPSGQLEVEVIPANPKVIGSRRFSLVYRVDGKTVKNISVLGRLKALSPVIVLTENVRRGDIIQASMVQLKTLDLSKLREPCTSFHEVVGKRLSRSLRSGAVLTTSSLNIPPVIMKGQVVKILINHKGIHLTATGIASMNGKMDQIIRVMNSGSRKVILCKVTAPGLVEVQI